MDTNGHHDSQNLGKLILASKPILILLKTFDPNCLIIILKNLTENTEAY